MARRARKVAERGQVPEIMREPRPGSEGFGVRAKMRRTRLETKKQKDYREEQEYNKPIDRELEKRLLKYK